VIDLTAIAVGLGLVIGLLSTELFGLASSGLIVPGYVALHLDQPKALATTCAVALATVAAVRMLSSLLLVHGRRRSAATILIGYLLGMLVTSWPGPLSDGDAYATVGLVIPGLVALWMDRQGVVETLSAVSVVSVLVRLVLIVAGVEVRP
jgi:poly-gamma-glutamate biosynthesis protein PgsC/CapC